ncbi:hypothetical protein K466DRAFT_606689 [Polyporus arcularius HHB13444]|uniref:Uncharacterized protein n=1 Tax=Polyporus arcularius HHB13444 TaxID=1314778 RepID=A0A5C3NND9_9APHY|nr:hypothetical protein K466DRAFT_606689 [Polyporus arcularius HHB13444]
MDPLYGLSLALAFCLLFAVWYVFHRYRRSSRSRLPGFVFSATTTVRRHCTTNLELVVPTPPDFHHEAQPTIVRSFVPMRLRSPSGAASPMAMTERKAGKMKAFVVSPCPQPVVSPDRASLPGWNAPSSSSGSQAESSSRSERKHIPVSPSPGIPPAHENVSDWDTDLARASTSVQSTAGSEPSLGLILIRTLNSHPDKDNPGRDVITAWFQTNGDRRISYPPHFVEERRFVGDLFYHRRTDDQKKSQLWLWVESDVGHRWMSVKIGYRRADGKYLSYTETKKNPSWIDRVYFVRREKENRL